MLKKLAIFAATAVFVFLILPALVFGAWISIQEGCLLCFEGEGRGGALEAAFNIVVAALIAWGIIKLFRKFG